MKALLKIALGFSLFLSLTGFAETEAEFRDKVGKAVTQLKSLDRDYFKFIVRSEKKEALAAFKEALQLIEQISEDPALNDGVKDELLLTLADECGGMFERLTEPFADVKKEPLSWAELRTEIGQPGAGNWFLRVGRFGWDRVAWYGQSVFRDVLRVSPFSPNEDGKWVFHYPFVFPWGSDSHRSAVTRDSVKATGETLHKILDRAVANDKENTGLKAMKRLFLGMETAEPIKWGASNNRFRRFALWMLAPYLFLDPPLDFWWFTVAGPTQASLFVSSLFEVVASMYLGRIRKLDSGLAAYWQYQKLQKELAGKPATKWQKLVAFTRLSKIPGMAFLGRGLERNEAYAHAYENCAVDMAAIGEVALDDAAEATGKKPRRRRLPD